MKLSYVASNATTVAQETLSMQWFNTKRAMTKLFKTVTAIMVGISIPSIVFQVVSELLNAGVLSNGAVKTSLSTFAEYNVTSLSVAFVYEISYILTVFFTLATVFKFMKNGDYKQFGKDIISLVVGFVLITFTKTIPILLPVVIGFISNLQF